MRDSRPYPKFARPEIYAFYETRRDEWEPTVEAVGRPFILEQEAARLHLYGLIRTLRETGLWGKI